MAHELLPRLAFGLRAQHRQRLGLARRQAAPAAGGIDRHHRARALGMLGGHDLHDHPAHRGAHHVRLVDAQRVEQAERIGGHVVEVIGCVRPFALHHLLDRRGKVGHAPGIEARGEARVAIVVADDMEALVGQPLEQRIGPDRELRSQPHDQQQCGIGLVADRLVFDLDAVCPGACHVASCHLRPPTLSASQATAAVAASSAASFEA